MATVSVVDPFAGLSWDETQTISRNIVALLRSAVKTKDDHADVAVNAELRRVIIFVNDEPVLTCSYDELLNGPGFSTN